MRLGWLWIAGYLMIAKGATALACTVCMGNPDSPLVKSANDGVLFMMFVISGMLVGFAGLFLFWARRARQLGV